MYHKVKSGLVDNVHYPGKSFAFVWIMNQQPQGGSEHKVDY